MNGDPGKLTNTSAMVYSPGCTMLHGPAPRDGGPSRARDDDPVCNDLTQGTAVKVIDLHEN